MNARQHPVSLSERAAFLAERHNRVLLNALQARSLVSHGGHQRLIRSVMYQLSGGSIETDVQLVGLTAPIPGAQVEHEPASWEATDQQHHGRVLLHALQTAHPVTFSGLYRFIHTLKFSAEGEEIRTTVYLTGSSTAVDSQQVTVGAKPSFLQHPAVAGNHSPKGAT
jgi:hypothetical protein